MIFIGRKNLIIIETKGIKEKISKEELKLSIGKNLSNSYYFESGGFLYGILSTGDLNRGCDKDICIKTDFTKLGEDEYYRALEIFKERSGINFLPVVDTDNHLVGEYCRYDDVLYRQYVDIFLSCFKNKDKYHNIGALYSDNMGKHKLQMINRVKSIVEKEGHRLEIIHFNDISVNQLKKYDLVYCVDYNAMWAVSGLLNGLEGVEGYYDAYPITLPKMNQEMLYKEAVLKEITALDIEVFMSIFDSKNLPYSENLLKKMELRNIRLQEEKGIKEANIQINEKSFYDNASDEYIEEMKNIGWEFKSEKGINWVKEKKGLYANANDKGERKTTNQPKEWRKTIFFFGPCFILGSMVEDSHTIESYLQAEFINYGFYDVRVTNYGSWEDDISRIRKILYVLSREAKSGDVVVTYLNNNKKSEFVENINWCEFIEKSHPPIEWFADMFQHCNHKANELFAKGLFEILKPSIEKVIESESIRNALDGLLAKKYIDSYFFGFDKSKYSIIGSIVMNCNPFTIGHRYLIEQAKSQCDFLIIFVVEEDISFFSFNSRFAMVNEGTKDLDNIMVVPSGKFILSQTNFPQYFVKIKDEDIDDNAEYDIEIFARDIAPHLNITKRFVGEEITDEVTRHYNDAMKKILPEYQIELVEIERKKLDGKPISATSVREHIKNNDIEALKKLVPKSTLDIMFYKCM